MCVLIIYPVRYLINIKFTFLAARQNVQYDLPRTVRETDFGTLCLLFCLWMAVPMSYFVFWCGHSGGGHVYYYATVSRGCLIIFTLRDAVIPLVRS